METKLEALRDKKLEELQLLDTNSKEYRETQDDLMNITKLINEGEKNEIKKMELQENARQADLKYDIDKKTARHNIFGTVVKVILGIGSIATTLAGYVLITSEEAQGAVTSKAQNIIPKNKIDF